MDDSKEDWLSSSKAFDFDRSRAYWRFAPSGQGKHDTAEWSRLADHQLERMWQAAFVSRFLQYPEEDCFAQEMTESLSGKRVLSVGSGLGFHELLYQHHGALVTCHDIVQSNLDIIRRVASIKRLPRIDTKLVSSGSTPSFDGLYDVGFVYGSLMTMPSDHQRQLIAAIKNALRPDGKIILMLYTWKFVESTCCWKSFDDFDPVVFARASDPSVGEEHCPWSDWHDDAKLLNLAGSDMRIASKQFWQHGLFVWYALEFGARADSVSAFFSPEQTLQGDLVARVAASDFQTAAATLKTERDGVRVETGRQAFAYALMSPVYGRSAFPSAPNAIRISATLLAGGFSVGILDTAAQKFVSTAAITDIGRHDFILPLADLSSNCQIVFSNHRPEAESSAFLLHKAEFIKRPSVVMDTLLTPSSVS